MKKVLITGASQGIGKAILEELHNLDYDIYATYNTGKDSANNIEKELKNVKFFQCDFINTSEVDKLLDQIKDIKFDAVINNSGMIEFENFQNFDFKIWQETFQVNLFTPLYLSINLQNNLNEGSSIINISSLDGLTGSFASMAYSASKAALINLTKSLGNNFGSKNVRVNAIAPGWIDTGMATEESLEAVKTTPLGRNGNPEEVANLVTFLISDKASFITGETIIIDGGYGNVDNIMLEESKNI